MYLYRYKLRNTHITQVKSKKELHTLRQVINAKFTTKYAISNPMTFSNGPYLRGEQYCIKAGFRNSFENFLNTDCARRSPQRRQKNSKIGIKIFCFEIQFKLCAAHNNDCSKYSCDKNPGELKNCYGEGKAMFLRIAPSLPVSYGYMVSIVRVVTHGSYDKKRTEKQGCLDIRI